MTPPTHDDTEPGYVHMATEIATAGRKLAEATRARDAVSSECAEIANRAYKLRMPEKHIAEAMGVNRRTVRRWLGKPE